MGAWIETSLITSILLRLWSHPTWVRGLKLFIMANENTAALVAPYVGAWIETFSDGFTPAQPLSHPTWVRGLKHV